MPEQIGVEKDARKAVCQKPRADRAVGAGREFEFRNDRLRSLKDAARMRVESAKTEDRRVHPLFRPPERLHRGRRTAPFEVARRFAKQRRGVARLFRRGDAAP